jgi:purine-binding chemotaxis protein CheW
MGIDVAHHVTQLCTFCVDDLLFGVDLNVVQEVIRLQDITPVPLAPTVVEGLINLRGQIVTAINIVVRHEDGILSLLVDDIGDVVDVDQSAFEMPPATLAPASRVLIDGVYKLESRLLLLLNTQRAVRVDPQSTVQRYDHGQQ